MNHDALSSFALANATGNTGTRVVGKTLDIQQARDIGNGQPIYLMVLVDTGIAAGGAGSYQVKLSSDTNTDFNDAPVDHVIGASFVTGTTSGTGALKPGTVLLHVALPIDGTYKRHLAIREVVTTENTTAGKISAFLLQAPNKWVAAPQGVVSA
jgi:hypothetical protein